MRPELRARAAQQGGVVTRAQAVACGYTDRELKSRTGHGGDWVVVRRGCYAERALWDEVDEDGRYLMAARAVSLSCRGDGVASHASAAAALGMPLRPRWRQLQHLTRPEVHGSRTESGVKHHGAWLDAGDVVTVDGLGCTGLARTAVDVAREHGYEDGVVAVDAARRLGAALEQLDAVLAGMRCWPGVTAARAAVADSDPGAMTVGESLLRLMVLELGLGRPQTQFRIREGGRYADVDLRLGRHLFEFDGKVKYLGREVGGVADLSPEDVAWREKQREDWIRRTDGGYGMSRVVWSEMFGRQRRRTVARLGEEVMATWRRYGDAMWR